MRKWLQFFLLAAFLFCFAKSTSAQGSLADLQVWRYTPAGAFPASGASVTICTSSGLGQPCTPKLTIYSDSALTQPVSNPLATCTSLGQIGCLDGLGNATFYMTPGAYTYTITGAGLSSYGPIPRSTSCIPGSTCVTYSTPGTFTQLQTFNSGISVAGATTFTGTGTIGTLGLGSTALGANNPWTGNETHTGIENFSIFQCKNLQNTQCVDFANTQGWSGADIGGWINSAYAGLPANGGQILVFCNGISSTANFSTPIVFQTATKAVLLRGMCAGSQGGGLTLNYTPTTATKAITFDYITNTGTAHVSGHGMSDIVLLNNGCTTNGGCGSSAIGIEFANVNGGARMATFSDVTVGGFGTGVNWDDTSGWGIHFNQFVLAWNTLGMSFPQVQENIHWEGGACIVNGTCANGGNTNPTDLYISHVSIDSNTVAGFTGVLYLDLNSCHQENFGSATVNYANLGTGSKLNITGGDIQDDNVSGTIGQIYTLSVAVAHISGVQIGSGGQQVTSLFNVSGGAMAWGDYFTSLSNRILASCNVNSACDIQAQQGYTGAVPQHNWLNTGVFQFTGQTAPISLANAAVCFSDSSASFVIKCDYNNTGNRIPLTRTIASGTVVMPTSAVNAGTCVAASGNPVTATGVLTTDSITWSYNAAPAANPAQLVVSAWPTSGGVNFQYCNPSAGNITPNAATLNWSVPR